MKKIVTKKVFMDIFNNPLYRKKLDRIILSFFGLSTSIEEQEKNLKENDVILEFIMFLNTEFLLKIIVKDIKHLFKESKKFYINLSYRTVKRHHELLMPCYWEIYCIYALEHPKKDNFLLLFSGLFACQNIEQVENILRELKCFDELEIKDIIKIIK